MNVWDISPDGKNEEELAKEGLSAMEAWMKELGLAMKLSEIGVTMEMIDDIVNGTLIMEGGYKSTFQRGCQESADAVYVREEMRTLQFHIHSLNGWSSETNRFSYFIGNCVPMK